MRRIDRIPESVFGMENSSVDSNRFYSILLDTKAAGSSESMCDTTEKLLKGEKENAKTALEQLWNLRKSMSAENSGTLDTLINFYQDKMDILRDKEDNIKKISRDSRSLVEEKLKRDEEIATVKQQMLECAKELDDLSSKLEKLKIKEQELIVLEQQLNKDLKTKESAILNGLYEVILSGGEKGVKEVDTAEVDLQSNKAREDESDSSEVLEDKSEGETQEGSTQELLGDTEGISLSQIKQIQGSTENSIPDIPPFPKSVVKTTSGKVIGEYYYDQKVEKDQRHYIFNSKFFCEQFTKNQKLLKTRIDQAVYSEMMQTIQDSYKRIAESKKLHFENSTNEILNSKTLKQLWQDMKLKSMDDVERFNTRLKAKIEALGSNYTAMLQEQMKRCIKS